ncbi:MAG: sigma-70 family RNA polymerase sigma factor [Thermoanaerobaculia bacterium]
MAPTDSGIPKAIPRLEPLPPDAATPSPATAPATGTAADNSAYEAILLEHLEFIERTVASVARRNAVAPWDAQDLAGQVKLRLMTNDYAVLRRFEGRSRLTTYLTTIIHNIFRDFRIQRWGKWRPSAAAKRMGDLGVQLEALLYRDRFGVQEAFTLLRERFDVEATDRQLESMVGRLRPRTTRRIESDRALTRLASAERGDRGVRERERTETKLRVAAALCKVLASLDPEDRLILRMRFADGLTIRAIAGGLDLEQRRMYTRVQRLLVEVRRLIEGEGIDCDEVLDLLDDPGGDLEAGLRRTAERG